MRAAFSKVIFFLNTRSGGSERVAVAYTEDSMEEVRLELESEHRRASVSLAADEVARLSRLLQVFMAPSRSRTTNASETFHSEGGDALIVTRTNWGEPYAEGARFALHGEHGLAVDIPDSGLFGMSVLLDRLARELEPSAAPVGPRR